jgi:nicotinamidase-related amidase
MIIDKAGSQLLLVDLQARLMPVVHEGERTTARACVLAQGARRLGVPITISEQYPAGLGSTLPAVLDAAGPQAMVLPKLHFSALGDSALAARLEGLGRPRIVMAGAEAHVCVLQSALAARQSGYQVAVVADAVSSRAQDSVTLAFARMRQTGIVVVNTEMVLFEWLGVAGTESFRSVLQWIR